MGRDKSVTFPAAWMFCWVDESVTSEALIQTSDTVCVLRCEPSRRPRPAGGDDERSSPHLCAGDQTVAVCVFITDVSVLSVVFSS